MIRDFTVPEAFAAQARAWLDGAIEGEPARPKPSSTVVLLRPGASSGAASGSPEAFLLRRHATMAFAARMHVFPGGGVDPRDADDVPWAGPSPAHWGEQLGADPATASELVCAAVRELFEECGVLLAGPADHAGPGEGVVDDVSGDDWEADRLALLDRSLALSDLLDRRGLVLRSDLLRAWAHWRTPECEPRRYDTRFFVAALPAGQRARDVGGEADRAAWVSVDLAVAEHHAGRMAMLPPTISTLEEIAAAGDVDAVLAARRTVRPVMPWPALTDDGDVMRVDLDGVGGGEPGPGQRLP